MRNEFKLIITLFVLLFTSSMLSQPYVRFDKQPPTQIVQKTKVVEGFFIEYNVPTNGYLYLALSRDNASIGNCVLPVKRGKRKVFCSIFIWDEKTLKVKGDYKYTLDIWKGAKDSFREKMVPQVVFDNVEVTRN
ncbi:hypothetical protein [Aquimarina agarilytica]|uniref:hypothetical protein n=1 Tax=Aquimarina agarilytica TaxID=1087449 RepID=UPI000288A832|nr:hypothetical protein [Aquimarina agarilytica]